MVGQFPKMWGGVLLAGGCIITIIVCVGSVLGARKFMETPVSTLLKVFKGVVQGLSVLTLAPGLGDVCSAILPELDTS